MKIFDCFMYFDEELVLDLRLNFLDEYIDYFVIVESKYTHKGEKRKLKFNHKKFEKFKHKIIYLVFDKEPSDIQLINVNDTKDEKLTKYIYNASYRENGQRNLILEGLKQASDNDLILISDVDEIPNLENLSLEKINQEKIFFKQNMFYYKFNLRLPNFTWIGTKGCKMKYLESPQWLRNIKDRKFPFYRLDTLFSKTKYINIKFINDGGWHFTNIKSAAEIHYKLRSYLHHIEFEANPLSQDEIQSIIENKVAIYDLKTDKRKNKFGNGEKLEKYPLKKLPLYLQNNINNYQLWLD